VFPTRNFEWLVINVLPKIFLLLEICYLPGLESVQAFILVVKGTNAVTIFNLCLESFEFFFTFDDAINGQIYPPQKWQQPGGGLALS